MKGIYDGSAGIFLVVREHEMPELKKKKKNHIILITSFHLSFQPIQIQPVVDIQPLNREILQMLC